MASDLASEPAGPEGARTAGRQRPFHALLREATREDHDAVDALFGTLGFADADAYGRFLIAHARALLPIEQWLRAAGADLAGRTDRGAALTADLDALDLPLPQTDPLDWPVDPASLWGVAYVIEGSRLGGAMLARQVPAGLPRAYLGSVHPPGGWRNFLDALETEAGVMNSPWQDRAIQSARMAFAQFAQAARAMGGREQHDGE